MDSSTSISVIIPANKGRVLQRLKRFVIHSASAVTVVSEAMRERISEIDPGARNVSVQPTSVRFDVQTPPTG